MMSAFLVQILSFINDVVLHFTYTSARSFTLLLPLVPYLKTKPPFSCVSESALPHGLSRYGTKAQLMLTAHSGAHASRSHGEPRTHILCRLVRFPLPEMSRRSVGRELRWRARSIC